MGLVKLSGKEKRRETVRVGVLGGGVSAEREISLISAREAHKALVAKGLEVVFIDICTNQEAKVKELIVSSGIDLAFIALHGEFGEDGRIQTILEELDITYTGSGPEASALAMDKAASKRIFKTQGITTPDFTVLTPGQRTPSAINYPVVVKPCSSGSSIGVSILRGKNNLAAALKLAFFYSAEVILEDYIEGREVTVGILDNQPLAVVEIIPKKEHFDFDAKYSEGGSEFIAPASLDQAVTKLVQVVGLAAHKALGCRHFSRVDIRLDQDNVPFVLEVNSIPGLTLHSLLPFAAGVYGINFNDLILQMVELALPGYKLGVVTG
ncbi:MAG: D-alanine--D-alanine ligase [Candidatus Omnitrophota bacterium]